MWFGYSLNGYGTDDGPTDVRKRWTDKWTGSSTGGEAAGQTDRQTDR
jgi:hypothetical protein